MEYRLPANIMTNRQRVGGGETGGGQNRNGIIIWLCKINVNFVLWTSGVGLINSTVLKMGERAAEKKWHPPRRCIRLVVCLGDLEGTTTFSWVNASNERWP